MEIRLTGGGDYVYSDEFINFVQRSNLSDVLVLKARLPHKESINEMLDADVLLLFQNHEDFRYQIPAKLFEYARTNAIIMSFCFDGATSKTMKGIEPSMIFNPNDKDAIKSAILDILKGIYIPFTRKNVDIYSRASQAARLASVFDDLVRKVEFVGADNQEMHRPVSC